MNREWVHAEHRIVPWTKPSARRRRPGAAEPVLCVQAAPQLRLAVSMVIAIAALITLLTTLPLLIVKIRSAGKPTFISSSLPSLRGRALEYVDKQQVLARMSLQARRDLSARLSYLTRVIRSANPHVDASALASAIVFESHSAQFDPFLVAAVILAESSFRSTARSHVGARGLMQIRPSTGSFICSISNTHWRGAGELHTPDYNIRLGIAYLKHLGEMYGNDIEKVLTAYNWGPGNLDRALAHRPLRIPQVTHRYIRKVTKYHREWKSDFGVYRAQLHLSAAAQMQS